MNWSLPVMIVVGSAGMAATWLSTLFVGSAIYDIRTIKCQKHLRQFPGSRRYRKRPMVSVVLIAYDLAGLEQSVKSVLASSYVKYEIIILANGSTDDLSVIKAINPNKIRIVKKKKPLTTHAALQAVTGQSRGEIIARLVPHTTMHERALKNAVQHFLIDDAMNAMAASVYEAPRDTLASYCRQFTNILRDRQAKTMELFKRSPDSPLVLFKKSYASQMTTHQATYKSDVYVSHLTNRQMRRYITRKYQFVVSMCCWLAWLIMLSLFSYAIYLAVIIRVTDPLVILAGTLTVYGLLFILTETTMHLNNSRIRLLSLLPAWLVLIMVFGLLKVVSPLSWLTRVRVRFSLAP